jgi:hypothetical protein
MESSMFSCNESVRLFELKQQKQELALSEITVVRSVRIRLSFSPFHQAALTFWKSVTVIFSG